MIPLFMPYMPELPELDDILHSGALAYGEWTKKFENALREYFGVPHILVTNTFGNAITITLKSLGIYEGNVIASPMGCLDSTQPYVTNGMEVRWADIDAHTGSLDPDSVEKRVDSSTKAIIHNHYCGYPGYIDEINNIGQKHGIPVIDDGIECLGSEYKGKLIGNCGTDVTIFCLTAVRFLNCVDGAAIIFKSKEAYKKALLLRDNGINRTNFRDDRGEINPKCDVSVHGYDGKMSNVNGYIGYQQMKHLQELLSMHRSNAKRWSQRFADDYSVQELEHDNTNPNNWVYGILAEDKIRTIDKFREEGFYASGVHIRNDIYSVFGKSDIELPGVEYFNDHFVGLPCGWWINGTEIYPK